MYQSFVNMLLESGYHKYMTEIGPVYICEKSKRQIVFLTYHKNQQKQPIYMQDYEDQLQAIKDKIFPGQSSDVLCIMIVDDGNLSEGQMEENPLFSLWIQDEQTGKLYMSKESEVKFQSLFSTIKRKSLEAQKALEKEATEEERSSVSIRSYVTPANTAIVIVNFVLFFFSKYLYTDMMREGASEWSAVLLDHEVYRLFTSIFLHFDMEHLLSNMFVLFLIGSFAERYLGTAKYMMTYFVCGVVGNMISFYVSIGDPSSGLSAGASGAIYGILGVLAVILWKTKGRLEGVQGPGLVLFVIGMIVHSYQAEGVDNWAHIGGLVMGIVMGVILKGKSDKKKEEAGE